jgi:DNA polymerase-3 subunit chi
LKIQFYVLEKSNNQQAMLHACQLIEKHYQVNERVYIHTASQQEAERLDQLLWTFKEDSFVAHAISNTKQAAPVQIGFEADHAMAADVLMNLSHEIPAFFEQYQQITEIVFADATVQQLARERFKKYRELGYEITTHKL